MSLSRGRFGVEYQPYDYDEDDSHNLRNALIITILLVGIAFGWYKFSEWKKNRTDLKPTNSTIESPLIGNLPINTETNNVATTPTQLPVPKPVPTVEPAARPLVEQLIDTYSSRPIDDRILLDRYIDAEKQENYRLASDALSKLYRSATMADMVDPLKRRLGDLNLRLLYSGQPTPWTTTITVRRGDSRARIAREYKTTIAAIERLNPLIQWNLLIPGDKVQVLKYPNAVLVVHQNGIADMSFKTGKDFFRRYSITLSKTAKLGAYPITNNHNETLMARFKQFGFKLSQEEHDELAMFMSIGSRIIISD